MVLNFDEVWFVFSFFSRIMIWASYLRNLCQTQGHKDFCPMFSTGYFLVLGFIFKSMIHFWLNFYVLCEEWIEDLFLVWHMNIQFFQHHLLKRSTFPYRPIFVPLLKSIGCSCVCLFLDFVPMTCLSSHKWHIVLIYYSIIISPGIKYCKSSKFILFSLFSYSSSLHFYMNFRISLWMEMMQYCSGIFRLYWIYRLLWGGLTFNIESWDPGTQKISLSLSFFKTAFISFNDFLIVFVV